MKRWIAVTFLAALMFAVAPVAQADGYRDRTVADGAVIGVVLGTIAGVIIASQSEPVYVVGHRRHWHDRDDRIRYERRDRERYRSHDRRYERHFRERGD